MVNYTGSLGFGQDSVEALLGQCGKLDVGDVIASAKHLVKIGIAEEGKGKQFVSGGSHGGFLSAHCEYLSPRRAHIPKRDHSSNWAIPRLLFRRRDAQPCNQHRFHV